ncbi:MAG: hypothetical protein GWO40_05530 [Gammaproteobacteria bacterium]|nr:hypothetical protein [Gammaproteobacteria bacterium]NIV51081.1 hypothetical protein [Gammaproteobacteria bacterium]NIX85024.1 hypothetical protein [Gammaproteobacteria bacterium]
MEVGQNPMALDNEPQVMDVGVLEQLTRGEVDIQVATARRFARDIDTFKRAATNQALANPRIAQTCVYALPRSGKVINGPSIRLAEIMAGCWGNLRCETRIVAEGKRSVTAQAVAWDLERNVLMKSEVQARIVDKRGKRYNDDMIVMTGNAACSKALRNAIFRVIPRAYVDALCEMAMRKAAESDVSLEERREQWLAHYERLGVARGATLTTLGRGSEEEITVDDIGTLQGIRTAIAEGHTTLEDAFGLADEPKKAEAPAEGTIGFGKRARKDGGK